MVELIEIPKNQLWELIFIAYIGDIDLLERFHVDEFKLAETATDSTFEMIEITEKEMQLTYYGVYLKEKPIGYVIVSGNHLYSFAINIEYRIKSILKEWWLKVKKILGNHFTCLLFSNNGRAINYLKNRGMKITWKNTENKKLNEILLTY